MSDEVEYVDDELEDAGEDKKYRKYPTIKRIDDQDLNSVRDTAGYRDAPSSPEIKSVCGPSLDSESVPYVETSASVSEMKQLCQSVDQHLVELQQKFQSVYNLNGNKKYGVENAEEPMSSKQKLETTRKMRKPLPKDSVENASISPRLPDDEDEEDEDDDEDEDEDDDDDDDDESSSSDSGSGSGSDHIDPEYGQNNGMEESLAEYRVGGYHPVAVGDIFQNRYYAIHKLGWGHFSTVWLCYDSRTEQYCAIKVVKSAEHYTDTARDEIRLLRTVAESEWHPLRNRLVDFRDYFYMSGLNGTHLCLVFEVLGDNLLTLIQRSRYQGLPLCNVKQIALQVLEGLCFLHTQCRIIHTDLKPENVLLVADDVAIRAQANQAASAFLQAHSHLSR